MFMTITTEEDLGGQNVLQFAFFNNHFALLPVSLKNRPPPSTP